MKVLLVDDEPLALERLEFAFRDLRDANIVGTARDGMEAAEKIASLKPDLAILDIQMPGRTGLSVAASLTAEDRPEIVFVTAYEQFAPDAFDVEAVDYLIKPVRFDRLRQAVERARRRRREREAAAALDASVLPAKHQSDEDVIIVPDPRGNRYVAVSAIDWIEAAKDYVLLHTASRSHMLRITMAELERRLDPAAMLRVHRSAFVRRAAICQIDRPVGGVMSLVLPGDVTVSVGPSYLRSVAAALRSMA